MPAADEIDAIAPPLRGRCGTHCSAVWRRPMKFTPITSTAGFVPGRPAQ